MTSSQAPQPDHEGQPPLQKWRRLVVYVVAAMALCVAIWALIEGGDRDLWTQETAQLLEPGMAAQWW